MLISEQQFAAAQALVDGSFIPVPKGIDPNTGKPFAYRSYQIEGIQYAAQRDDTLFGDDMGVGKTIEAIGTVNLDPLAHRVVIFAPLKMKRVWRREWLKWDVKHLSVAIVYAGKGAKDAESFPTTDVVILSYDLADDWAEELRSINWDVLIVDEAHKLKNLKAGRTQSIFGCTAQKQKIEGGKIVRKERKAMKPIPARRRLLLTGTPLVNKPADLWTIIHALDPAGLGSNKHFYEQRYCDGKWVLIVPNSRPLMDGKPALYGNERKVWSAAGLTHADELQKYLRTKFMIRRMKRDVMQHLPPIIREVIPLEANQRTMSWLKKEQAHHDYDAYVAAMQKEAIETPDFKELSIIRRKLAVATAPMVAEFVADLMEEKIDADDPGKICVFAHHHDVIDILAKKLAKYGVVVIDGRTTEEDLDLRFQNDASIRGFIGSISAAGEGITLTAADTLVYAEQPWTAKDRDQVEARIDRDGQTGGVRGFLMVYHVVVEGSLQERQIQIIAAKESMTNRALNPKREVA